MEYDVELNFQSWVIQDDNNHRSKPEEIKVIKTKDALKICKKVENQTAIQIFAEQNSLERVLSETIKEFDRYNDAGIIGFDEETMGKMYLKVGDKINECRIALKDYLALKSKYGIK